MLRTIIYIILLLAFHGTGYQATAASEAALTIPAHTAYCQPDVKGVSISERDGVNNWRDATQQIAWHGRFFAIGELRVAVRLTLPAGETTTLRMDINGQQQQATATGTGDKVVDLVFDKFTVPTPGWHHLVLTGMAKSGSSFGTIAAITLTGPASVGAHFNLKERRNCASVHLGYPTAKGDEAVAFYNEVTVRTDPLWSYYMACGFHRGYFGIQVNSPSERRIIFSVWDSGNEAIDRKKVVAEDLVQLVRKGDQVVTNDFGNEGTGGHSHLVYPWVVGTTYRFLVTAKPNGTRTTYTGWFYFPEQKKWGLIASFTAPKDGSYLRGLYSFNENFAGQNGDVRRLAEFGQQWIRTKSDVWAELTTARFTHDVTGKADRFDYTAGLVDGRNFFLSNGGFIGGDMTSGTTFHRPASSSAPSTLSNEWLKLAP